MAQQQSLFGGKSRSKGRKRKAAKGPKGPKVRVRAHAVKAHERKRGRLPGRDGRGRFVED